MIGDTCSVLVFLLVTLALPCCQTEPTTVTPATTTLSKITDNVTNIAPGAIGSNVTGDDVTSSFPIPMNSNETTPTSTYSTSTRLSVTGEAAVDPISTAATTEQAVNQSDAIHTTEPAASQEPFVSSPPPSTVLDSISTESNTIPVNSSAKNETGSEGSESVEQPSSTHSPLIDGLTSSFGMHETSSSTSPPLIVSSTPESLTSEIPVVAEDSSMAGMNTTFDPEEKNNATFIPTPFTEMIPENISYSENSTVLSLGFNNSTLANGTFTEIVSNGTFSSIIHDVGNNSNSEIGDDNVTSSWLNSSISVPSTPSTYSIDDDNVSIASTEESDVLSPIPTVQTWFLLQFVGNCTMAQEEFDQFEKDVRSQLIKPAGVPENNVSINIFNCSKNFLLNVTVSPEYATPLREFFKKLGSDNESKVQFNEETYYTVKYLGSTSNSEPKQPPEIVLSSRHTDIEFVIYVALGSACAFLLVLAVLLIMCKYCRTKPYKGFDVSDVGNLNLRLEDYTLTRIPRPKSIYTEYCRSTSNDLERYCPLDEQSSQANGMVHPFDTSVVPLEDAPAKVDADSDERAQGPAKINPSNHEYEEIDVNSVNSTENLHERKGSVPTKPPWGVDNASFAT